MPEYEKETTEQQRLEKEQLEIWARCGAPAAPMPSPAGP